MNLITPEYLSSWGTGTAFVPLFGWTEILGTNISGVESSETDKMQLLINSEIFLMF